jgi:beta-mannosidase
VQGYHPAENWFHLGPGETRKIGLMPETAMTETPPSGEVLSLGSSRRFSF